MKKAFYDLCRAAELAANEGKRDDALAKLIEANDMAAIEVKQARSRLEPETAAIYSETVWWTALSCGEKLGLTKNPVGLPPDFTRWGFGVGPRRERSSLDYRWGAWGERPVSYLPFAWPRLAVTNRQQTP